MPVLPGDRHRGLGLKRLKSYLALVEVELVDRPPVGSQAGGEYDPDVLNRLGREADNLVRSRARAVGNVAPRNAVIGDLDRKVPGVVCGRVRGFHHELVERLH